MTRTDESSHPMFVVLLRFAANKSHTGRDLEGHKQWIRRGLDDGVFLVVGSLQHNAGGAVLAGDTTLADLEARVQEDPLVANRIVRAEILEITPAQADERLTFLLA
jgi:uncharacterized protein YciI